MNRTLIALAALGLFGETVQAQSSVTLYGLLDANFGAYQTNQVAGTGATAAIQNQTQTKVDSSGLSGSRWGMRFSEDLGGGMTAVGNLEAGVNVDAGTSAQGGLPFGRRAIVGLAGRFGTVTLGRNTTPYSEVVLDHAMMEASPFDPSTNSISSSAATALTLSTLAGKAALLNHSSSGIGAQMTWVGYNSRFNNSIKYATPNLYGFSGALTYGFGEDKTSTHPASQSASASLKYVNGPLLMSAGYQSEGAAVNQATGAKPALQNAVVSVAYDLKVVKLGAGLNRATYKAVTSSGADLDTQNEFNFSAAIPFGAATFAAGYAQSKGDDLGKSSGFGLQALYALSKRTTLYAGGVSTKNYDKLAAAAKAQAPLSDIGRTTIYAAGIRHVF